MEEIKQKHREFYLTAAQSAINKLKEYITEEEEKGLEEQLATIAGYLGYTKQELKEYLQDLEENYS